MTMTDAVLPSVCVCKLEVHALGFGARVGTASSPSFFKGSFFSFFGARGREARFVVAVEVWRRWTRSEEAKGVDVNDNLAQHRKQTSAPSVATSFVIEYREMSRAWHRRGSAMNFFMDPALSPGFGGSPNEAYADLRTIRQHM